MTCQKMGCLDRLRWVRRKHMVAGGKKITQYLHVLKWACTIGCPLEYIWTRALICRSKWTFGHFNMAHANGCPWHPRNTMVAARNGHFGYRRMDTCQWFTITVGRYFVSEKAAA
jgi:hypothetical protein